MFVWNVSWSAALIFTSLPAFFLAKSAAWPWYCLAKVVPLSLVPQVIVPPTLPPPDEPPLAPPPLPPESSPPPQPASTLGRPRTAAAPSAVLNRERRLRLDSPATEGGTIWA